VPVFDGPVVAGASYVLIDDVVTSGGTIAAMRCLIEGRGGKVVAAMSLATSSNAQTGWGGFLAPQRSTLEALQKKCDIAALERLFDEYGIAQRIGQLTNSQARHIASFGSLDRLRDRIAEARSAEVLPARD